MYFKSSSKKDVNRTEFIKFKIVNVERAIFGLDVCWKLNLIFERVNIDRVHIVDENIKINKILNKYEVYKRRLCKSTGTHDQSRSKCNTYCRPTTQSTICLVKLSNAEIKLFGDDWDNEKSRDPILGEFDGNSSWRKPEFEDLPRSARIK